jgi:hypothetical protein
MVVLEQAELDALIRKRLVADRRRRDAALRTLLIQRDALREECASLHAELARVRRLLSITIP